MTKKTLLFAFAMMALMPLQQLHADPTILDFQVGYIDPSNNGGQHRTPVLIPTISIEGYTLYFTTPCDGCALRLLDADGEEVYSTTIPNSCASLNLPLYLSGTYLLQIICGDICFYTTIDF